MLTSIKTNSSTHNERVRSSTAKEMTLGVWMAEVVIVVATAVVTIPLAVTLHLQNHWNTIFTLLEDPSVADILKKDDHELSMEELPAVVDAQDPAEDPPAEDISDAEDLPATPIENLLCGFALLWIFTIIVIMPRYFEHYAGFVAEFVAITVVMVVLIVPLFVMLQQQFYKRTSCRSIMFKRLVGFVGIVLVTGVVAIPLAATFHQQIYWNIFFPASVLTQDKKQALLVVLMILTITLLLPLSVATAILHVGKRVANYVATVAPGEDSTKYGRRILQRIKSHVALLHEHVFLCLACTLVVVASGSGWTLLVHIKEEPTWLVRLEEVQGGPVPFDAVTLHSFASGCLVAACFGYFQKVFGEDPPSTRT